MPAFFIHAFDIPAPPAILSVRFFPHKPYLEGGYMDRRAFIRTAGLSAAALGLAGKAFAAGKVFPTNVDMALFDNINRVKDPAKKTHLEKTHAPVITAPSKVTAGKPFTVEVSVGEEIHPMGPAHWIEFIELNIGNEPAGRAEFDSRGSVNPKVTFTVVLTKQNAPGGKVTLVAHQRCNLHGYWEGTKDITVA
jgi:superoxide reductase